MTQWEFCNIKFEEVKREHFRASFEWQALSPSGEIIFAVEYPVEYKIGVSAKDSDKVEKEKKKKAHDQLIDFLEKKGWQSFKANEDGWITQMRRKKDTT